MTRIEEIQELRGAIQSVIESSQYQDDDWCENLLSSMQTWRERIEAIDHLTAELTASQSENTKLRAALAVSKDPCIYCQLPADEMAKCESGFPGCGRADDIVGCPHLGAELQLKDQLAAKDAEIKRLRDVIQEIADAQLQKGLYHGGETYCGMNQRIKRIAEAALAATSRGEGGINATG